MSLRSSTSDPAPKGTPALILGEDWTDPSTVDEDLGRARRLRGWRTLNRSPLARRIVVFGLLPVFFFTIVLMLMGGLRETVATRGLAALQNHARLMASVIQESDAPVETLFEPGVLPDSFSVLIFPTGASKPRVLSSEANRAQLASADDHGLGAALTRFAAGLRRALPLAAPAALPDPEGLAARLAEQMRAQGAIVTYPSDLTAASALGVAVPLARPDVDSLVLVSSGAFITELSSAMRERVLRAFVASLVLSVVLSLILAATIANPLADLAAAADLGRERHARKVTSGRIRIPDLTARPDEIGRLSASLRGMVSALYDRIEANEQFAADVAHEIKNPLASLRSAVASLPKVTREEHRARLLEVIDHDVRRLDRLVSDISNASRLDSELVREDQMSFDLVQMLARLGEHLGAEAQAKGVEFIVDLPNEPVMVHGLEGRLAQVFVNLITNAISFCEQGDAVRLWLRRRDNRVLAVVEDTGPGIPEQALEKIFKRFYSERPVGQFGEHSGLGLSISKQIVEAHGGVIWAENIRPTDADVTSEPLGARFVVGLPL